MRIVAALFSILMPGFGQIYNKQLLKGVIFVVFEHFDNLLGNINKAIHLDFNGLHQQAVQVTDFEYALFYPAFYLYTIWDAWYYAKPGADKVKSSIPYIIGSFLGDFGLIYANLLPVPTLTVAMLMLIPACIGFYIHRDRK